MATRNAFRLIVPVFLLAFLGCQEEWYPPVWVYIDPVQCLGNPWEQAWLEEHDNDYDSFPRSESDQLAIYEQYYEDRGVEIYVVTREQAYEAVCDACSCPRGDRIHCLIDREDLVKMLEWGFTKEKAGYQYLGF